MVKEEKDELCTLVEGDGESLDVLMSQLFAINGYKASAVLASDGELVFSDCRGDSGINLTPWMTILNNLFSHTCNLSEKSGFHACHQVSIRTGDEIVVIRSTTSDCLVGVRLLVLLTNHGNEAVVGMKLDKLLPRLMRCLIWNPDNLTRLTRH